MSCCSLASYNISAFLNQVIYNQGRKEPERTVLSKAGLTVRVVDNVTSVPD